MKKYNTLIAAMLLIIIIGISGVVYFYGTDSKRQNEFLKVSVILDSSAGDRWNNLKQGMNQAAMDYKVEINILNLSTAGSEEEQIQLLNREITNGAQGVLIIPVLGFALEEAVILSKPTLPILTLFSKFEGYDDTYTISSENYQMGYELGKEVMQQANAEDEIIVLVNNENSNYIRERKEGVLSAFEPTFAKITVCELQEIKAEKLMNYDRIVALDVESLDYVTMISEYNDGYYQVYGIGGTNRSLVSLDKGYINTLIVENEYNIGYIAIQTIAEKMRNNTEMRDHMVDYCIVNQETMYDQDKQRLLFPLVQ